MKGKYETRHTMSDYTHVTLGELCSYLETYAGIKAVNTNSVHSLRIVDGDVDKAIRAKKSIRDKLSGNVAALAAYLQEYEVSPDMIEAVKVLANNYLMYMGLVAGHIETLEAVAKSRRPLFDLEYEDVTNE